MVTLRYFEGWIFLWIPNVIFALDKYMEGLKFHGDSRCRLQFLLDLIWLRGHCLPAIRFSFFLTQDCHVWVIYRWGQHTNSIVKSTTTLRRWIGRTCNQYGNVVSYYADLFHLFFCMHDSLNDLRFPWTTQGAFSMNLALSHHPWYRRQFRPLSSNI